MRFAGVAIALGLAVQAATLYRPHPAAFLTFLGIGCTLVAVGIVSYLRVIMTGFPAIGTGRSTKS